eukprot:CAMPEP_0197927194 /NCGR_PEP_ID=MMETSP1439-20131203/100362_1 /TAXON_ID=66791 /ORGANISM="Gonyaulax spinifera, Strain CCMP409" /LENGTH=65 /DNA_ID=CAMNT_0043549755 /DNA_START=35 /DNA_END=230 /DNA_ORIENTATION=-
MADAALTLHAAPPAPVGGPTGPGLPPVATDRGGGGAAVRRSAWRWSAGAKCTSGTRAREPSTAVA